MKTKFIIPLVVLMAIIAATVGLQKESHEQGSVPVSETPKGQPVFEWSYRAFERDEMPYSTISLTAKYPNGTSHTKEIDTIEGSCNEYPEPDADVYPQSTEIICYYAGFGRYYKVTQSGAEYLVQRKEFEEASPDYSPPVQDFQTIARF